MAGPRPGSGDTGGTPRWVKVSGIVGGVLVLAFVVMMLTGHDPSRHLRPSAVTEHPVQQP